MNFKKWWQLALCFISLGRAGCQGERPATLGVNQGKLASCPTSPNCVSSQTFDGVQQMEPVAFTQGVQAAQKILVNVLEKMERVNVIKAADGYVYAEASSKRMGFVDDVEFYFDSRSRLLHFRSAARLGYGDGGVNRQRMEKILNRFATAQASMAEAENQAQ